MDLLPRLWRIVPGLIIILCVMYYCSDQDTKTYSAVQHNTKPPMTIYAYKALIPPVIDGDISEFQKADSVHFYHRVTPQENYGFAYVLWDGNYFYVALDIKNKNLRSKGTVRDEGLTIMKDDLPEVLIDCNNDKSNKFEDDDICYHVNLLGTIMDERGRTPDGKINFSWDGELEFGVKLFGTLNDTTDIDEGFTCELAIPWSEIRREPKPGMVMGINFCHNDHSDIKNPPHFDWCHLKQFHTPSGFGEVVLKDEL